jgi:hypothetical protein
VSPKPQPGSAAAAPYRRLDPKALAVTHRRLCDRITARFPDRHLGRVAAELGPVISSVAAAEWRRSERFVRAACRIGIVVVVAAAALATALSIRDATRVAVDKPTFEWLPILESGINDVAFAGIAVFFLLTIPARLRRRELLKVLHRLRSLAHVIDMHQLTKDPERLRSSPPPTPKSASTGLDAVALGRYLDYCSELLSLVSKTAALCADESTDAVVLDTVSEIESLTLGMSRKIWQKISLLHGPGVPPM